MYKSLLFSGILFFLGSSFVNKETAEKDGDQQKKFLNYLSYFEKVSLPYSLNFEDLPYNKSNSGGLSGKLSESKKDRIFYDIAESFLPINQTGRFSRLGRPILRAVARFFPDDKTVAVVYSRSLPFSDPIMKNYFIAYYDLKGNLLGNTKKQYTYNNHQLIGFTKLQHTQLFTILPSGKIEVVLYANHWEKELSTVAISENKLLGFKKQKQLTYEVSNQQGIQEVKQAYFTSRP